MFTFNQCKKNGCTKQALSVFDSETGATKYESFCFEHLEERSAFEKKVFDYINSHEKIVALNASGLTFSNINLNNKKFYGCNFQHCSFTGIETKGFRSRMSIFDFATFSDCNLTKSNMQFTSFGGATFSHVLFTGSDMIHNNFCGLNAIQSSFDDSDLYNSRFVKSKLLDVSFRNCNLKGTFFRECQLNNVSFKKSNTNEAIFDKRGSALHTGIDELDNTPSSGVVNPKGFVI